MNGYRILSAAALLLVLTTVPAFAQDFDSVEIGTTPLGGNLHLLIGAGGNIVFHVGPDDVLMIDAQYAGLHDRILEAIREAGGGNVAWLVNTHWHDDHTNGNAPLGEAGCTIVAHRETARLLEEGSAMPFFDYQAPPVPPAGRPSLVFDERLDLRRGGQTFEIRHIPPAHTSGDAVVYCPEADVLHAGDLYFNGLYPFIDVHNGGGIDGMIAAVESLIILCGPDTKVVPGHGPLSDRDGLGAYLRMLKGTRAEVARQMKGGKDLAAVAAAGPTAEWDGVWGDGFLKPEQFVQLVFDSLERDGI